MLKLRHIILILLAVTMAACNTKETKQEEMTVPKSMHPEWSKKSNIYEVNIRQYTKEGTFKAFEKHLERLDSMGVDIIWLMPINPIGEKNRKGTLGSYYSVKDYKGINPEFGTLQDFKDLVAKAHSLGMHIIIDWVANHTAWDNHWATNHPEYYKKDSVGNFVSPWDWTDVIVLDYDNQALRDSMIDAMKFWVKDAGIDGFRCDVAFLVPVDFWNEARAALDSIKPIFMLAEAEVADEHEKAFDMSYSWEMFKVMRGMAEGKQTVVDFWNQMAKEDSIFPDHAYRMMFTSNHDENTWNGTEYEMFGQAARTFSVFTAVVEGMPLIYNGQEGGLSHRLQFFEKDEITWDSTHLSGFYKSLIDLKNNNEALWNGEFGGKMIKLETSIPEKVLAFVREKNGNRVLAIFNMSNEELNFSIPNNEYAGRYNNYFFPGEYNLKKNKSFPIRPWEYVVLTQ